MYMLPSEISSEIQICNFGYLFWGHSIYVGKDSRIRHYFSNRKGVRQQEILGTSDVIIWNRIWRKRVAPQDPSFFNLQKIAEGTKHTLIQARLARWLIDMAWCC